MGSSPNILAGHLAGSFAMATTTARAREESDGYTEGSCRKYKYSAISHTSEVAHYANSGYPSDWSIYLLVLHGHEVLNVCSKSGHLDLESCRIGFHRADP